MTPKFYARVLQFKATLLGNKSAYFIVCMYCMTPKFYPRVKFHGYTSKDCMTKGQRHIFKEIVHSI